MLLSRHRLTFHETAKTEPPQNLSILSSAAVNMTATEQSNAKSEQHRKKRVSFRSYQVIDVDLLRGQDNRERLRPDVLEVDAQLLQQRGLILVVLVVLIDHGRTHRPPSYGSPVSDPHPPCSQACGCWSGAVPPHVHTRTGHSVGLAEENVRAGRGMLLTSLCRLRDWTRRNIGKVAGKDVRR